MPADQPAGKSTPALASRFAPICLGEVLATRSRFHSKSGALSSGFGYLIRKDVAGSRSNDQFWMIRGRSHHLNMTFHLPRDGRYVSNGVARANILGDLTANRNNLRP